MRGCRDAIVPGKARLAGAGNGVDDTGSRVDAPDPVVVTVSDIDGAR